MVVPLHNRLHANQMRMREMMAIRARGCTVDAPAHGMLAGNLANNIPRLLMAQTSSPRYAVLL